jgi:dienelactone hydrolase
MRISKVIYLAIVAGIGLLALPIGSALTAEQDVQFNSAGAPPTKFKVKRAKAKGIELKTEPGDLLEGILFRPPGDGPFPAVVMIHGCRGIQPYQKKWAKSLMNQGYLALIVDSFTTRNETDICRDRHRRHLDPVITKRAADASGAYDYLSNLSFVDSSKIGLLGWARNGVVGSVSNLGLGEITRRNFRAAIAFYPGCDSRDGGKIVTPLLILLGESDDIIRVHKCRYITQRSEQGEFPIELALYPEAEHAFDDYQVSDGQYRKDMWNYKEERSRGVLLKYDAVAHADAIKRVERFLAHHLSD